MKYVRYWTALTSLFLVVLSGPQTVSAQGQSVEVGGSLKTTYVFRGNPQYTNDETPSLELNALADFHRPSGGWILALKLSSSLDQRKANEKLGSAEEVIPSVQYRWDITKDHRWSFGLVDYLRPHDSQVNFRAEAFTRFDWTMIDLGVVSIKPFVAVYAEFLALGGVYGEVGADLEADLEQGFKLDAVLRGGLSEYYEGDENFNHTSLEVAFSFTPPDMKELTISGFISTSLTQNKIFLSTDFLERHNVTWSGLRITYVTSPAPGESRGESTSPL